MHTILPRLLVAATGITVAMFTRDAFANNLDIDTGDSYPTEVLITSPSGQDSLFTFNGTYAVVLSDSTFNIDANFNSDGSLNGWNSLSISTGLATGYFIGAAGVNFTLNWQSGSASNNAHLNAKTGDVEITLVFKITFTGGWKGAGETCQTQAFTVDMGTTTSYTYPYTGGALHGSPYSTGNGAFRVVSNSFTIADFPANTTCTAAHANAIRTNLSVGASGSGMKIDDGFPVYSFDSLRVHGS